MRIVGLCGYLGSGKSIAAAALRHDGYAIYPMAQVLKDMLRTFGLTEAQVRGDQKNLPVELLGGKTARHAMQTLGTEWGRDCIHEDVWLNAWWNKVNKLEAVVCDDLRFANEAAFLRSKGGVLIQIDRPGHGPGEHASEQMPFKPDHVVKNDGTIAELEAAVRKLAR